MEGLFEHIGFFEEYWFEGRFIGTLPCEEQERIFGYKGKKTFELTTTIKIGKKTLKQGQIVSTMYFPLCGKAKVQPWRDKPLTL